MDCEVCGSKNASSKALVEGAILCVCDNCIKMGEEVKERKIVRKKVLSLPDELDYGFVSGFGRIVRKEREKRKLRQEELGKKINVRASLIKRMEDGWEPSFGLGRKLEKFFNIKLIEKVSSEKVNTKTDKKDLTIGDIIRIGK